MTTILKFSQSQYQSSPHPKSNVSRSDLDVSVESKKMKFGLKKFSLSGLDTSKEYSYRLKYRRSQIKEQILLIEDERLANYYTNSENMKVRPMFIQRLVDSTHYLVMFPSGLLLNLSVSPFGILSKTQLYLSEFERIEDISYCVNDELKN